MCLSLRTSTAPPPASRRPRCSARHWRRRTTGGASTTTARAPARSGPARRNSSGTLARSPLNGCAARPTRSGSSFATTSRPTRSARRWARSSTGDGGAGCLWFTTARLQVRDWRTARRVPTCAQRCPPASLTHYERNKGGLILSRQNTCRSSHLKASHPCRCIAGPIGGFGWHLTFDEGSPRVLDLKSAQIRSDAPLLISIAYPANTGFTIVASAASWCHSSRTCSITFRKVDRRAPTPLLS
mmetsp:Transcript_17041/g.36553  ORF Transcript_17041/g.36553 Transcript_17041/m.36553 type:complete len:242 (-) Transcript_17041:587-1312(-)